MNQALIELVRREVRLQKTSASFPAEVFLMEKKKFEQP